MVKHVIGFVAFLVLSTIGLRTPAHPHSWYPKECCSNYDCVPADGIVVDGRGGKIALVGQTEIPIPDGFTARSSPDSRIHVCFRTTAGAQYGGPDILLFCLFLPAQS
jgi:hypothetical protein